MDRISFQLPALSANDPLHQQKNDLLAQKGFSVDFSVALDETQDQCELHFDDMLKAARILNVNEIEYYFLEADHSGPISFRNELEALHLLMTTLNSIMNARNCSTSLGIMIELAMQRLEQLEANENKGQGVVCNGDEEKRLVEWAQKEGIVSKLEVAVFEGCGRGGRAAMDIAVNDIVLKVPQQLIICSDTVLNTDMHRVLKDVEGVSEETKALLWSMRERYNPDSKFEPYFTSLPKSFNTGLGFNVSALKALDGTMVLEEILQAKEHLRLEYEKLFPALSDIYPSIFPKNFFTWDMFLWACELWYSNGLKVAFPDGTIKTCLVPIAGLLNHSLYPHITHYSRIDADEPALILRSARPCKAGDQCFLNYGTFQNSHLLMFYGFTLGRENPYDVLSIDIDLSDAPDKLELIERMNLGLSHMIRGCQFSRSPFGIPSRLLSALRIAFLDEDTTCTQSSTCQHINENAQGEVKAYEVLLSILSNMLDSFGDTVSSSDSDEDVEKRTRDEKLAISYKNQQRQLLQSACDGCCLALKTLTP